MPKEKTEKLRRYLGAYQYKGNVKKEARQDGSYGGGKGYKIKRSTEKEYSRRSSRMSECMGYEEKRGKAQEGMDT